MADDNALLKILIQLGVLGQADVKAARDLLAETGETGKRMGNTLQEVGEKTAFSSRELRMLGGVLGQGIPGASELMRAGMMGSANAAMGSIAVLIGGVQMLQAAIKNLNDDEAESKRIGQELNSTEEEREKSVNKVRDALEEADVAENVWLHNLTRNAQNAIDRATQLAQAILKSKMAAAEGEDTTGKSAAVKEIEEMEKRGVLSHAAALKAKEDLDIAYEQRKMVREMAQDAVEQQVLASQIEAKKNERFDAAQKEQAAKNAADVALAAKTKNDEKISRGEAQITRGEKALGDLEKKGVTDEAVQKIQAAFQALTGSAGGKTAFKHIEGEDASDKTTLAKMSDFLTKISEPAFVASGIFSMLPKMLQDAIGEHTGTVGAGMVALKQMGGGATAFENLSNYQNALIDIQSGKSAVSRGEANRQTLDTNAANAKSDLEAAREEYKKAREEVQTLQTKLNEMAATNAIKEGGGLEDLGMAKASASLLQDRATAENIADSTAAQRQKLTEDASKIAGHTVSLGMAIQIIENGANNLTIFMNQLAILTKVMGAFTPRQAADLQDQIDKLQRQVIASASLR